MVCAHNAEASLADCLRGLQFCDEIVVVADRCTDRTQDIARQFGALVIDGIFPLESQRKQAGARGCSGEWILEVEPGETVSHELAYEVRAAIHGHPSGDYYRVPMANHVGEALVRRGWGGPVGEASIVRLYRRAAKHWTPGRVHAAIALHGVDAGALETPLRRQVCEDAGGLIARLNHDTWLAAQDLADGGEAGGLAASLWRGLGRFSLGYLGRGGRREGEAGLLVALAAGLYPVLACLKAREILRARAALAAADAAPRPFQIGLGRR